MTTTSSTPGTAVVTGASSGIGKVYADRLARRGFNLLLVARRADRLAEVAADLKQRHGVEVQTVTADLANPADLTRFAARIAADTAITLLVNNAGTTVGGPLADSDQSKVDAMLAININALTALTIAILPGFKARDRGTIINIGSVVGYSAYTYTAAYGGTKAYVLNFTRSLQQELAEAKSSVRVQLVTPAATVSEIWEVGGFDINQLDPATVMTTEALVDASLKGLDLGESITAPPIQDPKLLADYLAAADALLMEAVTQGQPAPRYRS